MRSVVKKIALNTKKLWTTDGTEILLVTIDSKESFLVTTDSKESFLVTMDNKESFLVTMDSKESFLVTMDSKESCVTKWPPESVTRRPRDPHQLDHPKVSSCSKELCVL